MPSTSRSSAWRRSAAPAASTIRTSSRSRPPASRRTSIFRRWCAPTSTLMRQMPGIIDAAPIQQVPLSGSGSSSGFYSLPNEKGEESPANTFWTDEHGVNALGVKLSGGTTFDASAVKFLEEYPQFMEPPVHREPGLRRGAVPEAERAGQDLLRQPQHASQDRRRHRAHARLVGGLGQGGPRDTQPHDRPEARARATSCAPARARSIA